MQLDRLGRYEVRDVLGRGGAGIVFLAHDPLIGRDVALKTLRMIRGSAGFAEAKALFLREVRAAGGLRHPGIVTIYDVGEDPASDVVFIAMEFLDGATLEQRVAGGTRMEPSRVVGIGRQVSRALDYAHFQGIVHRDIKPANLIEARSGQVKITDFGVAKVDLFDLTFGGKQVGTPHYMSPEQIRGRGVDARSDIFSLGIVLYELLTGTRPFTGSSLLELTERIVEAQAPAPVAVAPEVPDALSAVVATCLAKRPDDRYQSCDELARALDAACL